MKVITLTRPWATLVAFGEKMIETRSWSTRYRGPLAIHAASGVSGIGGIRRYRRICGGEPFQSVLCKHMDKLMNYGHDYNAAQDILQPFGAIMAVCELFEVVSTDVNLGITDQEKAFGDYSPGRFAWILRNVQRFEKPIPAKGKLGLWDYEINGVAP